MAKVKINSPIKIHPVTKGPRTCRAIGLITRKASIADLYQSGEFPRKFFLKVLNEIAESIMYAYCSVNIFRKIPKVRYHVGFGTLSSIVTFATINILLKELLSRGYD